MPKNDSESGADKRLNRIEGRDILKDFTRSDLLFSLCGLNCGLCPMHLDGHCPGCGGGEGNQSCKIARCSLQHGKPEYCGQCQDFPCEKYENIDVFDSFVTHQNQKKFWRSSRKSVWKRTGQSRKRKSAFWHSFWKITMMGEKRISFA